MKKMIELPVYPNCIVCGNKKHNPSALGIQFTWDGDRIDTKVRLDEYTNGYKGIVHGGIQSAVLDEALGWAVTMVVGNMTVTAELKVKFIKPLKSPGTYRVIAEIVKDYGYFSTARGHIQDDDGKIFARASGKFHHIKEGHLNRMLEETASEAGEPEFVHTMQNLLKNVREKDASNRSS